ncbi:hypothetical protein [Desulfuromonas sp. TF]|uniref:hypothetical protein n=1 Tax=Desulfuromonas sp. TF TaxID=1232410 RepID=UPI0004071089|nr:hypothetical protein [Desulfuromonas sp. TF]
MEASKKLQITTNSIREHGFKFLELIPDTEDLTLITLKGHLIIEEILYFIVIKHCQFPKYIAEARLSFSQLSSLTKAMINVPIHDCVFPAIDKLNKLRNNLAHNITPDKAIKLAKEFVNLCDPQRNKDLTLPQQVRYSIVYVLGQLTAIGSVSEKLKGLDLKNDINFV